MYDVIIEADSEVGGSYRTDLSTGSRRYAVERARRIAGAYPWTRKRIVRIIGPGEIVDFNIEP